jgi:hypothetical protein
MRIQLYDETGDPATGVIDFEGTVWCEGQLDEVEEDTIEHLEIGEVGNLNCGWTVKRFPDDETLTELPVK